MEVIFNSKIQEQLIKVIPYFKGSWLLYCNILKFLPFSITTCKLREGDISIDLSDPPQFSIVKLRNGINELVTTKFIRSNLKAGDVFIDVGANWGYFTCIASKIVGEKGLVLSFEPLREAFSNLLKTISRNKLFNVIPFNIAVGEKSGGLCEFTKSWYRQSTSAYQKKEGKKDGRILTTTCDQVFRNIDLSTRKVKIIKIDVEGAELLVLRGALNFLSVQRPLIIVEPDLRSKERFGVEFSDLINYLKTLNYIPLYALNNGDGSITNYSNGCENSNYIVFGSQND